jgi:hypothetical protein
MGSLLASLCVQAGEGCRPRWGSCRRHGNSPACVRAEDGQSVAKPTAVAGKGVAVVNWHQVSSRCSAPVVSTRKMDYTICRNTVQIRTSVHALYCEVVGLPRCCSAPSA